MRLIDADALLERMEKRQNDLCAEYGGRDAYLSGFEEGMVAIEDADTIEAASVVHSHWIVRDLDAEYKRRAICPRCGWIAVETHDGFIKLSDFNFCAHCGAKMDEKENEK